MALAASMGAYGHGLELGEMSMSYANVKANPAAEDESPPVLSPSNPLAAYFGFEAGDDGSLLSPSPKANAAPVSFCHKIFTVTCADAWI